MNGEKLHNFCVGDIVGNVNGSLLWADCRYGVVEKPCDQTYPLLRIALKDQNGTTYSLHFGYETVVKAPLMSNLRMNAECTTCGLIAKKMTAPIDVRTGFYDLPDCPQCASKNMKPRLSLDEDTTPPVPAKTSDDANSDPWFAPEKPVDTFGENIKRAVHDPWSVIDRRFKK